MDARFLDMLHHARDPHLGAVAQGIDIAFDRIAQILVDQDGAVPADVDGGGNVAVELRFAVDDLHRAAAEHVGRAQQHRVADPGGDRRSLVAAAGDAVVGLLELQLADQLGKALAVFGKVNRVGRGAEDRDPGILQRLRELERGLPAELDDHAEQFALRLLDAQDLQHVLVGQRLEIQPVGGVVIGRDGLGVAVDHDGLEALFGKCEAGVDAAIVELDPLPDAVGAAAEDDDLLAVGRHGLAFGRAEAGGLVGRIHIRGNRLELGGAAVDALEDGEDAELVAQGAHFLGAGRACHGDQRVVEQPRTLGLGLGKTARHAHRPYREGGKAPIRKAHRLQAPQPRRIARQAIGLQFLLGGDDRLDLAQEPRVVMRDRGDVLDAHAFAERLADLEQPVGRTARERGGDHLAARTFQLGEAVEAVEPGFESAQRLLHALLEIAPDRHDLADRFHRGRQVIGRALELFKREAGDLGDDVINGRLEAGRRRAGDLVGQLVERVTHRQLRRDAGDGEARCLGRQRRGAADARVHLDHDQAPVLGIDRELDVGAARLHPDLAQHRDAGRAHDLVFLVGQRQRRGDGDAVAGVHPHRIDVLDRADDDRVVLAITHHLHLEFLPPEERFLDQDFGGGRGFEAFLHDLVEFGLVIGDPAPGAAEGEAGPDDRRQPGALKDLARLFQRVGDARARGFQPDLVHRVAEPLAVLGFVDRVGLGPDHLDAVFGEHAHFIELERAVQRGLPAHCRQQRIGAFLGNDLGDDIGRDRLDIGGVGKLRIGHDRRGVGVDEDDAVALLLQRLDRLGAGIVELAGLADDDRSGADDEDRGNVGSFGHQFFLPKSLERKLAGLGCGSV